MTIHHATVKKAEKIGVQLTEEDELVRAFWPKRAVAIFGASAQDALAQAQAAIAIMNGEREVRIETDASEKRLISVLAGDFRLKGCPMPPVAAHAILFGATPAEWENTSDAAEQQTLADALSDTAKLEDQKPIPNSKPVERINGIAVDGAIAYREGTPAGDCPYSSETEDDEEYANFERWNEEWDAAADEASDAEEKDGGSVVAQKYRAKYAEMGHPTHCGDWLADTLNEICLNKAGVNLELFEAICGLNGVDTSKYKREGRGWEGRIRMTGRNMVARRVFLNDGKLILPETLGSVKQAPAEWMAAQRFKAPKKAAPATEATT